MIRSDDCSSYLRIRIFANICGFWVTLLKIGSFTTTLDQDLESSRRERKEIGRNVFLLFVHKQLIIEMSEHDKRLAHSLLTPMEVTTNGKS